MKSRFLAATAFVACCACRCLAGLGGDDSWFNGSLGPAPPTPTASPVGGGPVYFQPSGPPPPTKEELEAKDLAESSDDFVDKGNKWYKAGRWEAAIAYYRKALRENPDNDDAQHNLQKAEQHLREEQRLREEEQARIIAEAAARQRAFAEAQQRAIAQRDGSIEQDRQYHNDQLQKLMSEADHIRVPPPAGSTPAHIHEGILLGLFDPQEEAEAKLGGANSPFSGHPYDKGAIFSTADSKTAHEALRGFLDNQTVGEYTLNTDYGRRLVERLNGTHFDRLIAHSNGATIAEALIGKGVIKVDELNVMGGDRSLVNQTGYQNLIDSGQVKRVVVWINPGDTIPIGSSLAYVTPMGRVNVAPLITSAEHAARVLSGDRQGGDARVEYRLLKGPEYTGQDIHIDKTIFQPHDLEAAYLPNVAKFFAKGAGGYSGSQ